MVPSDGSRKRYRDARLRMGRALEQYPPCQKHARLHRKSRAGSWDGMWAFEAEALGASLVVATDCSNPWQNPIHYGLNNLLLVHEALFSQVLPLWNVSPYVLRDRLDNLLYSHPLLAMVSTSFNTLGCCITCVTDVFASTVSVCHTRRRYTSNRDRV
jgi:hypothetical protein